jgi:TolB-like protein/Flp pilus assembly protein TadD
MDRRGFDGSFLFDGFRLEPGGLFRLDSAGLAEPVSLGSRAFDLLRLLVERHGDVVAKDAIMGAVWPGAAVEKANLTMQIARLRRVLDLDRTQRSRIQTISGRGYRFVAPVTEAGDGAALSAEAGVGLLLPGRPSIAVLPFANLSDDPGQQYFADGMVEEIITALSRIRWLFVIARNSSFAYKGHDIDVKQIGRELGVRYVLEGSVRKAAARVRIAAQLVDAIAGAHLWADHFDGAFDDIFELQDQVAASVAAVIEPTLEAVEIRRSNARPTRDLTAYDLYLRALPDCFSFEKHAATRALALFEQAIARDPHFGPALALAAYLPMQLIANGWVEDAKAWRDKSIERAHRALHAAGDDPSVLAEAAYALAALGEDIATMLTLADRALAFNPNFARGWFISGVIGLWAGDADRAVAHVETALRLSPRDRLGGHYHVLGAANFFKRRYAEAEANLLLWMQDHPHHPNSHRFLAACYAHMGRLDEARAVVERLRGITAADHVRILVPQCRAARIAACRLASRARRD